MTTRALVTGGNGFVGQWLIRSLLEKGWEVTGSQGGVAGALLATPDRGGAQWVEADVRRVDDIERALDASRPDVIFHLAAIASIAAVQADPGGACDVNVGGAVRLLAAVAGRRQAGTLDPTVVIVGSGEEYGKHPPDVMPLAEHVPLAPLTLYAATKVAQEVAALQVARHDGVRVVCTRSFNHSGPGQREEYLLPALVGRVLRAKAAGGRTLRVGNLSPVRDFLHVSDVVEAYCVLAQRGVSGEVYNVCSGQGRSVRDLVELVMRSVDFHVAMEPDERLVRAVDVPHLVGDPGKLTTATGWRPVHSVDHIVEELVRAAA